MRDTAIDIGRWIEEGKSKVAVSRVIDMTKYDTSFLGVQKGERNQSFLKDQTQRAVSYDIPNLTVHD